MTVLQPISSPDVAFLRRLQDVKPESANADFVDALIVGVDMLASVEAKKGVSTNMRLFLVTDAGGSVNSANLDEITKKMNELQISLNVVGVDFEDVLKVTKVDEESKAEDGIKVKKEEEMTEEEKQVKVKEELASQSAKYFSTPKKDGSVAAKDPKKARKLLNESTLRDICSAIEKSTTVPVGEALDIMHYFQTKSVTSTPNFRGFLEIGTVVKIPVWTYLKTKEDGFPRLVAISKRSSESHGDRVATMEAPVGGVGRREREEEGGDQKEDNVLAPTATQTMGVAIQKTYVAMDNPDEEISREHHVRGYKYGKTWVTSVKNDVIAPFTSEACLKVIGFTAVASVPRHFYTSNTELVVPYSGDSAAAQAIAALCDAMNRTGMVGIVRVVKRKNSGPILGVLTPHISEHASNFYLNRLPFNDDLRLYGFSSLVETEHSPNVPKHAIPTETQLNVTEDLINSLDLSNADVSAYGEPMEALKPKYTYNPSLQYFYQVILSRALKPNMPMPTLDDSILAQVSVPESFLKRTAGAQQRFRDAFVLTKTEMKEKENRKRFWSDAFTGDAADDKLESYLGDEDAKKSKKKDDANHAGLNNIQALLRGGVETVTNLTPIEDFTAMMGRKDVDLVDKAIEEMQLQILRFVHDSYKNSLYSKAIECIRALRSGCIKEQESEQFNNFLQSIKSQFKDKQRNDFWLNLQQEALSLISAADSADSDVSLEDARDFYASDPVPQDVLSVGDSSKPSDKASGTAEELFDLLG